MYMKMVYSRNDSRTAACAALYDLHHCPEMSKEDNIQKNKKQQQKKTVVSALFFFNHTLVKLINKNKVNK